VCECPGDQRRRPDRVDDDDSMRGGGRGRGGPQRAANEQSSITLASPYRMYLFFLSSAPSLLLALGPLCFEGSVGRYFMVHVDSYKIHAGFWAENLITCLDNR